MTVRSLDNSLALKDLVGNLSGTLPKMGSFFGVNVSLFPHEAGELLWHIDILYYFILQCIVMYWLVASCKILSYLILHSVFCSV